MPDRDIIMTLKVEDCRFTSLGHNFTFKGEIYKPGILLSSDISDANSVNITLSPDLCDEIIETTPIGSLSYIDFIEHVNIDDKEINIASAGNQIFRGVWTDGVKIYAVSATAPHQIHVFDFNTHEYLEDENIPLSNTHPFGIWSDGTTIWVSDTHSKKIFAYSFTEISQSGPFVPEPDPPPPPVVPPEPPEFDFHEDHDHPQGITSDGTTLWVGDYNDDYIYAYTLATGVRNVTKEPTLHSTNTQVSTLWTDGTTLWVADSITDSVFAYTLATGVRDTTKEFNIDISNVGGMWSDGTTMWIKGSGSNVYAYTLATGVRDTTKEFNGIHYFHGLWSDGTTMWIGDQTTDTLYAYTLATGVRDTTKDFVLPDTNIILTGIWSDGYYLYVSGHPNTFFMQTSTLHVFSSADGWVTSLSGLQFGTTNILDKSIQFEQSVTFTLPEASGGVGDLTYSLTPALPAGLTFDVTTRILSGISTELFTNTEFTYVVTDESSNTLSLTFNIEVVDVPRTYRKSSFDFNTLDAAGNDNPAGIYGFDGKMYVVDSTDRRLYRYDMTTKAVEFASGITGVGAEPVGVCILNDTIYISDINENNIKAWDLHPTFVNRNTRKDINLHGDNINVQDITAYDEHIYAVDWQDRHVYVYDPAEDNVDHQRKYGQTAPNSFLSQLRILSGIENVGRQQFKLQFETPEDTLLKTEKEYWSYEYAKRKYNTDWFKELSEVDDQIIHIEMEK